MISWRKFHEHWVITFFHFIQFREESKPFELGIFLCPLIPAVQLFICSIDHFGFLAQFVGICPIAPPYFIRSIFPASPPAQSGKAKHRCRQFALCPRFLGFQPPIGDTGCALLLLLPHWSNPIPSSLWLVGSDSGGWSVGGLGGVLRARGSCSSPWRAYLCLHSHRQPAQVLTLGGDY